MATPSFQNISNTFYVATRQMFSPYLQAIPKQIKMQNDLREVRHIREFGRERPDNKLYDKTKEILFNLDKIANMVIENLAKMKVPQIKADFARYLDTDYPKLQKVNKSFLELKDLLSWINDDYLLSTFLFHLKLSKNFIFSADVPAMQDAIKTGKVELALDKISDRQVEIEIVKAIIVLTLDSLLIWAAFKAKMRNDYAFILRYEEQVSNSARVLARANPRIARKMSETV
jgi:hypothetical protein